jgi:hypothetical protein
MRTFKVSDELYEQLKAFVVDPFDDTPDIVIGRLIEIVNKAKNHWSPFDTSDTPPEGERAESGPTSESPPNYEEYPQEEPVVVL